MIGELFTVQPDTVLVRQGLQNLQAKIPQVGRLGIYRCVLRIKTRMRQLGSRIDYPVRWDTERQRRAFFASDGFGRGIPTYRTGDTAAGWEITSLTNGYQIANRQKAALFLYGDMFGHGQSTIHRGRWPSFEDVSREEIQNLPADVAAEMRLATIAEGFSPGQ